MSQPLPLAKPPQRISLILTVKNEGDALRQLLDSICMQSLLPYEIVVTDGGSADNTITVLREYEQSLPLKIISIPQANISQGRNLAIAHAQGEIIACTDGGVVLHPNWLEAITRPIRLGNTSVVSGWFESDPHTDFEVVMGATVLPSLDEIDPASFLPSSRSIAFTKQAWQDVGGYPEWLDYCEDLLFDFALRREYGSFAFAPRAVAYFRPRGSLRAFAKQYYFYARGDGKADLWRKRHAIRYVTYLIGFPALLWLIAKKGATGWLALGLSVLAYCRQPWRKLWPQSADWPFFSRLWSFGLVPVIRVVGDVAKMVGYPVGVWWRLTRKNQ